RNRPGYTLTSGSDCLTNRVHLSPTLRDVLRVTRPAVTTGVFSISGSPSCSPSLNSPTATAAMPVSCVALPAFSSSSSTIGASNRLTPVPVVPLRDPRGTLWAPLDDANQPDPGRQMAPFHRRADDVMMPPSSKELCVVLVFSTQR